MSRKKKYFGVEGTSYLTAIYESPGLYPDGYNAEFHRDMGVHRCEICTRLYSEHTPEEFTAHWDELVAKQRKQPKPHP